MLRDQLRDVLDQLSQTEYRTAGQLAKQLGVSEKTARIRIKELQASLEGHGACIVSKAHYGYQLLVEHGDEYRAFLQAEQNQTGSLPETSQERSQYLMAYLLNRNEYIKLDDLSEFLYISRTALTQSLKNVEAVMRRYNINIERRPNYGIRIHGSEFDIRRLMGDYFIKRNTLGGAGWERCLQEMKELAGLVWELMARYEIHLSELAFDNFVDYLYIAGKRIERGNFLRTERKNPPDMGIKEKAFVRELIAVLEENQKIHYTGEEETYILLYLAGKRMIGNVLEDDSNFVIRETTDRLALAMIDCISKNYHMNFHNNFDIRMALNQHLAPFDIRMRYGIPLKNPMLEDIKSKCSLAYQMAYESAHVLKDYYGKDVSEDEIGYFALIFALALEKDKSGELSDILVVCSSGKGSSRLLKYKYEHEFSGYINQIYVCDLLGLETFDFSKVDYVFTTVPITGKIPVPIVEVGLFLGTDDIQTVTDVLKKGKQDYLEQYYTRERFLHGPLGGTKEEILEGICRIIRNREQVDDNFYDLVMERETYVQMDYGNYISIPHPNQIASEYTFAYVAVLDQPVIWNRLPVQVVILTSVGRKPDKDRQKFYEATARFALSGQRIRSLIKKPEYEKLMELLRQ